MGLIKSLDEIPSSKSPFILTIGNFDGVHLGHQKVLEQARDLSKQEGLPIALLTFSNHPSTILRPNHPIRLLSAPEQKLRLLKAAGVDLVIMLPFTDEFSRLTADAFLDLIREKLYFRILLLGFDGKIGSDRIGNSEELQIICRDRNIQLHFVPAFLLEGAPVSSSRIRKSIETGDLASAKQLLGRNYSVSGYATLPAKAKIPQIKICLEGLALPPFGVYAMALHTGTQTFPAVANLGFAPTVRNDHKPFLEAVLLEEGALKEGDRVEAEFKEFIRPERNFPSLEALNLQIQQDIKDAKSYFQRL